MFKKVQNTYGRKAKPNTNVAQRAFQAFSCEEEFDRLVNKDTQHKTNDLFSGKSGNLKFFKYVNAWRAHNDTSDFVKNTSEVSNPLFKDIEDSRYQMSFISTKGQKNRKIYKRNHNKIKKKKIKNKIVNIFQDSITTPKQSNKIICSSTPVHSEKAMMAELTFSPISDPFRASSLSSSIPKRPDVLLPRISDIALQFNKLQVDSLQKIDNDLLSNTRDCQIDIKKDPMPESNYFKLLPAKKWRRSLLKLKKPETCATRVFTNGRKSCTSTLIATLNNNRTMFVKEEPSINILLSNDDSIQAVEGKTKSKTYCKELKLDNPYRRTTVCKRPTHLFGIKEVDTPNKHQFSNSHKEFDQSLNISHTNALLPVNCKIGEIKFMNQITTRRKPAFDKPISEEPVDVSSHQILEKGKSSYHKVHPRSNELISDSVIDDTSKLNISNEITEKRKSSCHKVSLRSNELIPDCVVDDISKLNLGNEITENRKSLYHKVSLRSNELISDSVVDDTSKLNLGNETTENRKSSYHEVSLRSNELISDSVVDDTSKLNLSNEITENIKSSYKVSLRSNELISGSVVDDKSKLNLRNETTENRKSSYHEVSLRSNELISNSIVGDISKLNFSNETTENRKSLYHKVSLRSNELISDVHSARPKRNVGNLVLVKLPTIPDTESNSELQTKPKDDDLFSSLTESSDNSYDNFEVKEKSFGDVSNFSDSPETSKSMEIIKGFDVDNRSSPVLNSYKRTAQSAGINIFRDRYLDSSVGIGLTPPTRKSSIECASKVGASAITKPEEMMEPILTELNNLELTSQNDTLEQGFENYIISKNVTDRKSKIRDLDHRQMLKSRLEFTVENNDVEEKEKLYSSDPILFGSEEEYVEDPNDGMNILQNKSNTNNKIEASPGNITSSKLDIELSESVEKLHHVLPKDNDTLQSLQQSRSELSQGSFKGWSSEPDNEELSINSDTKYSSEADVSEVCSSVDEFESDKEPNENVSVQNQYGLSEILPSDENEVAFRCILHRCGQDRLVNFKDAFPDEELRNSKKVGEGVYGEVFLVQREFDPEDSVIKIIPVQGNQIVNGEVQKKFSEIISELIISQELSMLRESDDFFTDNFCRVKKLWCLEGKYPQRLHELWDEFDKVTGSENDSPKMFHQNQQYIALELGHAGEALSDYKFASARQSFSIFLQTSFALAVGEVCFQFEHRDLHLGNVLVKKTKAKFSRFTLDGETYSIPNYGVKATIIDYTLSRMLYAGSVNFNDLSLDPDMFKGTGDYQFDIYRIMQQLLCDDWSRYVPETNVKWLDYLVDKLLNGVKYNNTNSKLHLKFLNKLRDLRIVMGDFQSTFDFADYLGVYKETADIISQDENTNSS